MNIKTLITTLAIVGSSTAAMASPGWTASAEGSVSIGYSTGHATTTTRPTYRPPTPQVDVRDHRNPRPVAQPAPRPIYTNTGWHQDDDNVRNQDWNHTSGPRGVVLADSLNFASTEYRKDIVPGATSGKFQMLKLEGDRGTTYVMKVVVEFSDGGVQQIDLGANLRAGQTMDIDLSGTDGRALKRVLVYRADALINQVSNSEFSVLGF